MKLRKVISILFLIPLLLLTFGLEANAATLSQPNYNIENLNVKENYSSQSISTKEYIIALYPESGVCHPRFTLPYFNRPIFDSPIVGYHYKGESVYYTNVVITNLYIYVGWIDDDGLRKYMPVKDVNSGRHLADCYN